LSQAFIVLNSAPLLASLHVLESFVILKSISTSSLAFLIFLIVLSVVSSASLDAGHGRSTFWVILAIFLLGFAILLHASPLVSRSVKAIVPVIPLFPSLVASIPILPSLVALPFRVILPLASVPIPTLLALVPSLISLPFSVVLPLALVPIPTLLALVPSLLTLIPVSPFLVAFLLAVIPILLISSHTLLLASQNILSKGQSFALASSKTSLIAKASVSTGNSVLALVFLLA